MGLGRTVLVPITNPRSATALLRLAAALTDAGGAVVPFTVVSPTATDQQRDEAHDLMLAAEEAAQAAGVDAHGMVDVDQSVAASVLDAVMECGASLVVMGWQGHSSHRNVFGRIIDSIVGRSSVPLAVARLGDTPFRQLVLPFSDEHLASQGGVGLAAELTRRLGESTNAPVRLLRTGQGGTLLPADVAALSDRLHHDPRRLDLAVATVARPDDLLVVPVAPTVSGLRTATTHVAWAAPDASLLVAVDVGTRRSRDDLAPAVEGAGYHAVPERVQRVATEHSVGVSLWMATDADDPAALLEAVLAPIGDVTTVEYNEADAGRTLLQARVTVQAPHTNAALALVMEALHHAPGFEGAEITYESDAAS